ncbi:MAG: hypothetical protein ACI4NB_08140 [Candidatus Ornithospirochaeta sp.]
MRKGLYILLAILLLIVGCDTKTAIKTGEICVNVDGRSVDPISMETSYYSISVTSGNNVQRAPRVEGSSPARFNVEAGEWTVVVDAYNDHGDRIGTGSEVVNVVGGESKTCNVTVKEIEGTGTLVLKINVTSDADNEGSIPPYKMLEIFAIDENSKTELYDGYFYAKNVYSYKFDLSNGRYFIEISDGNSGELITDPIPVRVVDGAMTFISGEYHYDLDGKWSYISKESDTFRPNESYHIVLESEEVPIDCELRGTIEYDYGFDSGYNYSWYLNGYEIGWGQKLNFDLSNQYYREQTGIKVGGTYMLSVKVTDGYSGKDPVDNVNVIYYDYKFVKIVEEAGLPERIEVTGLPEDNEDGSIPYISSDSSLSLKSYAVNDGESSHVSGNWYFNDILVSENTDTLSFDDLKNFGGRNDVRFEFSSNGYSRTYYIDCFYVKPDMELDIELKDLKAGKLADISVAKTSGQYDGEYSLYFDFFKYERNEDGTEVLSPDYSRVSIGGNYPSEPGKYAVKYKICIGHNYEFDYEESLGDYNVEESDFRLDSVYGDNIIQGGMAEFKVSYPYKGDLTWYLDDERIKTYGGNAITIYGVEWKIGLHTIKAVDSDRTEYSYDFNVLSEEEAVKFDLEVTNLGNYKYEIKVVPVSAVSEDFNYSSTVYLYGYRPEVFNLKNNETVIVDKEYDEHNRESFGYSVVTTYNEGEKELIVGNKGYYESDDISFTTKVSLEKFLYVGNENIIVDIKLEEGYKPDQYQYLFYLDGTLIDIDFEGDGEYLLPMVEEGMHQFEMEILWNSGDSNASYTTIFMHSEEGYTPIKANEVYLSCGSDSPFKENEGGTKTYDYFGVKCSSLVLSDDGYCYFCIIKANDASGPVIQTIPCQYTIDKAGNYIFKISDEKQIVYTKVENRLERVEYDSLLPYSFVKYEIDPKGQNDIYGNWRFITPNFTQDMLNSFIQKYLPGHPISFDKTGEKLNLSLNLSVTGEWINAYLDLSADFTGYDMSLAEGTTIHLEGKIEYEEEDGYLSFMGSRYPIYLQVSEDGTVLLLHVAIPGCPEGTPFIVVPFTRVSSFYNPIVNISRSFNESKRITIDGVKKALELLCEKQFASDMLSEMMLQKVWIDSENAIEPGKYSVEGDKSIIDVLGEELLVVNGNLCFISGNSMTILKESEMNEGLNFQSYDNYGVSYYSITKSGDATYNVSYEKQGMPYRKGTITLKNEVEGIAVVQEFIGKYMEINDGNNPNDIYIEFDNNGDIYYKYGDEFLYMVAHYGINNEKIVIYADAADISDIMGEEVDGWGVKAGIVLPYDGEQDQITLIDDVFIELYPVL